MTDISKCTGSSVVAMSNCPVRANCRRYTSTADKWNSWIEGQPDDAEFCDYYLPIKEMKQ